MLLSTTRHGWRMSRRTCSREQNNTTRINNHIPEQDHDHHGLSTQQQIRTLQQTLANAEETIHHTTLANKRNLRSVSSVMVPRADAAVQVHSESETPHFRGVSAGVQTVHNGIRSALPVCDPSIGKRAW